MNKLSEDFAFIIFILFVFTVSTKLYLIGEGKQTQDLLSKQVALNTQYLIQYNRVESQHKQWSENEPTEYRVTVYASGDKVLAIIPGAKWCDMEVTKWEKVK